MKIAVGAVLVLVIGGGLMGLLLYWEPWQQSSGFCTQARAWQDSQKPFLKRVDEQGARREDGLSETYTVFYQAAEVPLPYAESASKREGASVLREVVRVEEAWLSELGLLTAVTSENSNVTRAERIESLRRSEDRRIELNDLLREANTQLSEQCGLQPLPIYSE